MASRPIRAQDPGDGAATPSREDAMDERDDIEPLDDIEATLEHPPRCGCLECDPDFYFERGELHDLLSDERCAA